jgi:hypothetical protein
MPQKIPNVVVCYYADASSVEQLNRPSLKDVIMESNKSGEFFVSREWEDIGIQLDIADEKLAAIRRKHTRTTDDGDQHHDSDQAFRDMIRDWVKQDNPPPTWSNFAKALERLNRFQRLSDRLRSNYGMCIVQYGRPFTSE